MQIATQARQVLTLCEQKGSDKVQLEYDPRNPFDICSLTFTPIYRQGLKTLSLWFNRPSCPPCMPLESMHSRHPNLSKALLAFRQIYLEREVCNF